ncbi:DNRLRE domain-containing protein [Clostridium botulinum]|uniref:DNRLRE domain-containing protein n=2 Tax=Clostridium botulinum TaxID=1491 RepID=UPI000A170CB0|nr:DNRLRE domain-containing protein [Clostridium botulinum]MBY6801068.1 DNRLRE domain-containing protein [Clostridium botulinum]NFC27201.1 DNRLRE domain-containing protein [Clostridium botulinum]NFC61596.1 DNRLRE domain-containing protein [Clostridium botulinum]NFC69898.1 DNRLRE domain-containing protein [Clostridium botulinum]NFE37759.1 DNRLRE domain-containing protein [Clostridium botulinum]
MRISKLKRKIGYILLSCMIVSCMPTNVLAETINNGFRNTYVEPQFGNEDNEQELETKIVKEALEKRESNVKHFLKEDNSYEAVIYNDPVHYLDNGVWKDIDNSFSEIEDKKEYTYKEIDDNKEQDRYINEEKDTKKNNSNTENNDEVKDKKLKDINREKTNDLKEDSNPNDNNKKENYYKDNKSSTENESEKKDNNNNVSEEKRSQDIKKSDEKDIIKSTSEKNNYKKEIENKNIDKVKNTNNIKKDNLDNTTDQNKKIKDKKIEKQKFLINKNNDFKVKIAKNAKSNQLVTIQKNKYKVQWKIDDVNSSLVKIIPKDNDKIEKDIDNTVENKIKKLKVKNKGKVNEVEQKGIIKENEKDKTVANVSSEVKFENIRNNIDLQYNISSQKLKEYIILNNKVENPEFKFKIKASNLIPKIEEDNSISFYAEDDSQKKIFDIDAPFMIDANNVTSDDIKVELIKDGDEYILVLKPNTKWLNNTERKYPVKIDPTENSSLGVKDIQDAYVNSSEPNKNRQKDFFITVGYGKYTKVSRGFIKFNKLPKLSSSEMVVKATIELTLPTENKTANQVNVHEVKKDWSSKGITWNNKPDYNNEVLDYEMVKERKKYSWDISSLAKKWYTEGSNYGIMFKQKQENPGSGVNEFLSSDNGDQYSAYRPVANIAYVNTSGIENYWTYHSQDAGRAGTVYVNDYTGNLTLIHDDLELNGNKMPISLKHIYNTNEVYDTDSEYVNKVKDSRYGNGFRLNLSQKIKYKNGKYVYTDEDGTRHYFNFNKSKNLYEDETGIDLKLKVIPNDAMCTYTVTDKDNNKLIFLKSGYLYKIKDKSENTITLSYNGATLTRVIDGVGREVFLNIYDSGYLKNIEYPKGTVIASFAYNGGKLSQITYMDGKKTQYLYNSKNNRLETVKNINGSAFKYDYYTGSANRISKITEIGMNNELGTSLNLKYGYNTTEFKNINKKGKEINKKEIYQFNNQGNTISVRDENGQALYYKYSNNISSNKLTLESKLQKTITNFLKNHNAEYDDKWKVDKWGKSEGVGQYDSIYNYSGKRSLKITKNNKGDRHFYSQELNLEKGKKYTFSAYTATKDISNSNKKGAAIFINYQNKDGKWETEESKFISGTNDWVRNEIAFELPKDSASNTVYARVGIVEETGTAYFDCLQLEEGVVANRYNLIENPNFIGQDYWSKSASCTAADKLVTVDKNDTTYPTNLDKERTAFLLNGEGSKEKNVYQSLNLSGKKGDVFVLGGWAKANSVALKSRRYFALDVGFERYDGKFDWKPISFNEDSTQWQYICDRIIADNDYKSVKVYCIYYNNENKAYFDAVQLYREEFGVSYKYDENGNIVSVKDLSGKESKFQYNGNNELINKINPDGSNYRYDYDDKNNLIHAISGENVVYSFQYDKYGNPVKAKVGDDNLSINTESTYTEDGNYMKSIKDSRGNIVTYDYDRTKGNLKSVKDAKGSVINNNYDSLDRLKDVEKKVGGKEVRNDYEYNDEDQLASIKHNGFEYNFSYDNFGRNSSVTVGKNKQNLTSTEYDDDSGKVIKENFGNNQYIKYGYDDCHRVNSQFYGKEGKEVEKYNYAYDAEGNLALKKDLENDVLYRYNYDLSNRITEINNSDGEITKYNYDDNNNIKTIFEKIYGKDYTTNYSYNKDNKLTNVYYNRGENKDIKGEKFPLNNNTSGLSGTTAYTSDSVFEKDKDSEENVLSNYEGTKNLLSNSSFESDLANWTAGDWSKLSGKGRIVKDGLDGNKCLEIYDDNPSTKKGTNTVTYQYVNFSAPISTNKQYNLSTFAKRIGNAQPVISIMAYDANNKEIQNSYVIKNHSIENNKWTRIDSTFTVPKNTKKVLIALRGSVKDSDRIRFDKVQLEEKPYASPYTASQSNGTRTLYKLRPEKTAGTMSVWFNTKGTATGNSRIVLSNETDKALINLYIDSNNKLNLALKKEDGTFVNVITLNDSVTSNTWHFAAIRWQLEGKTLKCKVYLDKNSMEKTISDFKDFSGCVTGIGSSVPGKYQINGYLKNFNYCREAIKDEEINNLFKEGKDSTQSHTNINYNYDNLGRLVGKNLNTSKGKFNVSYGYEKGKDANSTTNLVKTVDNDGNKIEYSYDANENIDEAIYNKGSSDEKKIKYYYDEADQLIREDNKIIDKTVVYDYDVGGNITSKKIYKYTTEKDLKNKTPELTYNYKYEDDNWKDKLTKIEIVKDGKTTTKEISSDNIGNFTKYDGYTFDWESGRQLKEIKGNGKNIEFEYNDEGMRTRKITDDEDIYYHVVDDKVTYEVIYNNDGEEEEIYYTYDGDDRLVSLNFKGQEYYYVRNAENDIIALTDNSGKVVVSYAYDSWGKLLGIEGELKDTLGVKNPYRYKGYRYDSETGLYYLKARYYNPELGRFISVDAVVGKTGEILSHNLFSYCANNPVNAIDEDGNRFEWIKSKWNAAKKAVSTAVKKVVSGVKRVAARVVSGVKKAVRSASNWVRNKFRGRTYTTTRTSSNRSRKWINTGWKNIKKAHHTIVRYTSPRAMVNPKRYASQERMNEDIGTRILKDLQEDMVFVASVLTVAMTMSEINDTLDMYSLSGNGINVFSPGKGFRHAREIGGDSIKGGSKAKNLYKFTSKGNANATKNIVKGFDTTLNAGKQGKHIVGHNNYIKGKSIVKGTMDEIQKLVNDFAGKGEWIGANKERIDFGKIIGQYVDPITGKLYDTTKAIIHYSKKGVHIVPSRP